VNNDAPCTYKAIVWVGNGPGERVEVVARTIEEASVQLRDKFGEDAVVSLWNEADANAPR
jgi:hypothetical protein